MEKEHKEDCECLYCLAKRGDSNIIDDDYYD